VLLLLLLLLLNSYTRCLWSDIPQRLGSDGRCLRNRAWCWNLSAERSMNHFAASSIGMMVETVLATIASRTRVGIDQEGATSGVGATILPGFICKKLINGHSCCKWKLIQNIVRTSLCNCGNCCGRRSRSFITWQNHCWRRLDLVLGQLWQMLVVPVQQGPQERARCESTLLHAIATLGSPQVDVCKGGAHLAPRVNPPLRTQPQYQPAGVLKTGYVPTSEILPESAVTSLVLEPSKQIRTNLRRIQGSKFGQR